ncbi:diguanylate cyclase domain-containing protein [Ideonella sp.]|uniref:GGDEF domain-containing protein n=1 Tax=Ideonella sp. TaxID=1929293 RepID=UPI003BB7F2B6
MQYPINGSVRGAEAGLAVPRVSRGWHLLWLLPLWLIAATALAQGVQDPVKPGDELARLEYDGRARPDAVAEMLEQKLPELATEPRRELQALRVLGSLRATLEQPEPAQAVIERIERFATVTDPQLRRDAVLAAACLKADLLRNTGPLAKADSQLEEAVRGLNDQTPPEIRLSCLAIHATIKENLGRFDDAVRLFHEAIRLADLRSPWRGSSLRSALSYTLYRAGQAEQAWVLNAEAKLRAQRMQDWLSLAEALSVEGILLTGAGKDTQELEALTQAIAYARRAGAGRDEALGLANLSDHYLRKGEFATAYALAQQALPLSQALHFSQAEQLANTNSGLALIAMKRKDEGLLLVREAMAQQQRADEIVSLAETHSELGRYLELGGYHDEALEVYRNHRLVAREAFRRDQQRALVELQEGFEAERRRHAFELLTDDNQLKQEALRQSELRFRQWALATAVAATALALLLLGYLRMRSTQRVLRLSTERLKLQSEQDALTGLANRRHFQMRSGMSEGRDLAQGTLYLLDLDHFKRINDRFGHAAGDAVLIEAARRLKAVVREQDLVVRWGGEEFLILVEAEGAEQVELLAERLLAALASVPVVAGTAHIAVTASIGFASFPLHPGQLDVPWAMAIDLVDSAMYIAKTQGRNRAVGIRRMPADGLAALETLMQDLEAAWRDGVIQLVEFQGPAGVGQTE